MNRMYEVLDFRCWMVLRWSGLAGLDLPAWALGVLKVLFNQNTTEGVEIDLLRATIDYGLNRIPTAQVSPALGRDLANPAQVSLIHLLSSRLKMFLPVSVYASGKSCWSEGNATGWPMNADGSPRAFRVFDGYVVGPASSSTDRSADLGLSLVHWLSDLDFSSATSRSSSPLAPSQLSYNPALPFYASSGGEGGKTPSQAGQFSSMFTSATVTTDLWGGVGSVRVNGELRGEGGIKSSFITVSGQDRINYQQYEGGVAPGDSISCGQLPSPIIKKNVEALAALKRFEPFEKNGVLAYTDGVPLRMQVGRNGLPTVAASIAAHLGSQMPNDFTGTTLWQKLLYYGSQMQFVVTPGVEKALVVPFTPGLRGYWTRIRTDDYDALDMTSENSRPIRGVALFASRVAGAGGLAASVNTVGGFYENPKRRHGMVVTARLPEWLSGAILPQNNSVVPGRPPPIPVITPEDRLKSVRDLWCDYARAAYIQKVLEGRSIRLSGRVRFDIMPGSSVLLERPVDPFVQERLNVISPGYGADDYTAMVTNVSLVLDAENLQAGSTMQLSFHRGADENADDAFSTAGHPIWDRSWTGAPLVSLDEFYPPEAPPR